MSEYSHYDGVLSERESCARQVEEFNDWVYEGRKVVGMIDGPKSMKKLAALIRGSAIIDNACSADECGHRQYCEQQTRRLDGWHHCSPECPNLKVEAAK